MFNREEILNFTPINHLLRPDYLGVGTTGVESFQPCIQSSLQYTVMFIGASNHHKHVSNIFLSIHLANTILDNRKMLLQMETTSKIKMTEKIKAKSEIKMLYWKG